MYSDGYFFLIHHYLKLRAKTQCITKGNWTPNCLSVLVFMTCTRKIYVSVCPCSRKRSSFYIWIVVLSASSPPCDRPVRSNLLFELLRQLCGLWLIIEVHLAGSVFSYQKKNAKYTIHAEAYSHTHMTLRKNKISNFQFSRSICGCTLFTGRRKTGRNFQIDQLFITLSVPMYVKCDVLFFVV